MGASLTITCSVWFFRLQMCTSRNQWWYAHQQLDRCQQNNSVVAFFHLLRTKALLHRLYPFTRLHNQQIAQNNLRLVLAKVKGTSVVVGHNACPLDAHRVAYSEAHVQQNVQYLQFTCLPMNLWFFLRQIWNKIIVLYVFGFLWACFILDFWNLDRHLLPLWKLCDVSNFLLWGIWGQISW